MNDVLVSGVVFAAPVLLVAAMQWWAVWLVRRVAAPRWLIWVMPVIVVVSLAGVVMGVRHARYGLRSFSAADPDKQQALWSAAISEGLNGGAFFCFPLVPFCFGVLAYFSRCAVARRQGRRSIGEHDVPKGHRDASCCCSSLGGHLKSGQSWTPQNRPPSLHRAACASIPLLQQHARLRRGPAVARFAART